MFSGAYSLHHHNFTKLNPRCAESGPTQHQLVGFIMKLKINFKAWVHIPTNPPLPLPLEKWPKMAVLMKNRP